MVDKIYDLLPLVVNERTGIIRKLEALDSSFLPIDFSIYSAILSVQPQTHPFNLNPLSIGGVGKNKEEAISKCFGEAIERYCGYYSIFWEKTIYASYQELKDEAVEPEKFALFSDSQYRQPDFPFSPFTKETKIYWVKGKNLVTGKDCFVPAQLCFLSNYIPGDTRIGYSTSNGLACGYSYNEAVEKAIYEIIERDAFMIMWLNQLKFPILKLEFEDNCWLSKTLNNLNSTNYRAYTYILDNDTGVSTCLTATLNVKKGSPLVSFGSSTNLDLNKAIEKSVIESLYGLCSLLQSEKNNINIEFKEGKPLIKDFNDHALLYKNPDRYKYISFLIEGENNRKKYRYHNSYDYGDDNLGKLIALLKRKGYEIIIIDLIPEEFRKLGFWVVKAMIPEFIGISLGDWVFKGGRRVYEVPEKIGFKRKREDELNPELHPFP